MLPFSWTAVVAVVAVTLLVETAEVDVEVVVPPFMPLLIIIVATEPNRRLFSLRASVVWCCQQKQKKLMFVKNRKIKQQNKMVRTGFESLYML